MFDCASEILSFHDDCVRLAKSDQDRLRSHRNANRERVKRGLKKNENPSPRDFVVQGSYAMFTIIQQPSNDYDIDDGVVFLDEDLGGPKGGDKSPLDARKMVCDAVQDPAFATPPEVRTNCVRVYYSEGHHVDIPVYREGTDEEDNVCYELASTLWRHSDPEAVTKWFNEAVKEMSPDDTNGRQMRRVVRLIKSFARSRESWNMPSGFIISVLVSERYQPVEDRDDAAFLKTIREIHSRLQNNLTVDHPVVEEKLTLTTEDSCMAEMRDRLGKALDDLAVLEDAGCTRKAALQAWKRVFNTDFFDDLLEKESAGRALTITGAAPRESVDKRGGGRFG